MPSLFALTCGGVLIKLPFSCAARRPCSNNDPTKTRPENASIPIVINTCSLSDQIFLHLPSAMDEDDLGTTQPSTQPQAGSQPFEANLWGRLTPCLSPTLVRMEFWRATNVIRIGRAQDNDVVLPGFKISNRHAIITWIGDEEVILEDLSSNGTFVGVFLLSRFQADEQYIPYRLMVCALEKDRRGLYTTGWRSHSGARPLAGSRTVFATTVRPSAFLPLSSFIDLTSSGYIYRHLATPRPTTGLLAFYDIGIELGKGSFATVWKVMELTTGQWWAAKRIKDVSSKSFPPTFSEMTIRRNTSASQQPPTLPAFPLPRRSK